MRDLERRIQENRQALSPMQKALTALALLIPPTTSTMAHYYANHQTIPDYYWTTIFLTNLPGLYMTNLCVAILLLCIVIASKLVSMTTPASAALAATALLPTVVSMASTTTIQIAIAVTAPLIPALLALLIISKKKSKGTTHQEQVQPSQTAGQTDSRRPPSQNDHRRPTPRQTKPSRRSRKSMTANQDRKLTFTISALPGQVNLLFETLHQAGFDADPQKALTCRNDTAAQYQTAVGADAPDLVQEINKYLWENDCRPLVPENTGEWDLERLNQFLELAMQNFDWEDQRIANTWWSAQSIRWHQIVRENPQVFTED